MYVYVFLLISPMDCLGVLNPVYPYLSPQCIPSIIRLSGLEKPAVERAGEHDFRKSNG